MIATRAARAGCVFTLGAAATAITLRPSSFARLVEVRLRDAAAR